MARMPVSLLVLLPHASCGLVSLYRMNHAYQNVGGQQRGSAAGKEGKGNAHYGEDGQAHAYVFQCLGDEDGGDTRGYEHAVVMAGLTADPQYPHDQNH